LIAQVAGHAKQCDLCWFAAIINVNLAVFNLPIPVLDGGHLLFFPSKRSSGVRLACVARWHGALALVIVTLIVLFLQ
jgi:membrane-associated protease RseP (regulator of RpoE activity)